MRVHRGREYHCRMKAIEAADGDAEDLPKFRDSAEELIVTGDGRRVVVLWTFAFAEAAG